MAILKCKMCGGELQIVDGENICECEYCGSKQTVPTIDNEKKITLFDRANRLRMKSEFDKAASVYEAIATEFPEEAESYWGMCLCKYGIEYVDDPATGKKIPTCHRTSYESIFKDVNFDLACEYADDVARGLYREEAKEIDRLQKSILEIAEKEEPFDIFICYKETDNEGKRTKDSVRAQEIYTELTKTGYKVFFSRITLEDKLGEAYEPYIFAALNSAKIMLAVGTSFDNYNAVWVKNEWSRFLELMKKDSSKKLIPCYSDIDAYDMPEEFSNLQGQDMAKIGFLQDLLRGIDKVMGNQSDAGSNQMVQASADAGLSALNAQTSALLKRGFMAIEDGEWEKADEFFEQVLNNDAECGQAYWGKVLGALKVKNAESFAEKITALIKDEKQNETINVPMPNLAEIARKADNGRGLLNVFTDKELNGLLDDLNPEKAVQSAEKYYKTAADKLSNTYIGGLVQKRDFDRTLQYADAKINVDVETIIAKVKASIEGLAQKEKETVDKAKACSGIQEEIEKRLSKAEAVFESSKEKINQARAEAEKKAEADFNNAVALWNQKKTEYEQNYAAAVAKKNEFQEKIKALENEMANVKGMFANKKKKEIEDNIAVLKKNIEAVVVPINPGSEPKRENFKVELPKVVANTKRAIKMELSPIYKTMIAEFEKATAGNNFTFGTYKGEPVTWKVIAQSGEKKLIITEDGIDTIKYNEQYVDVTWETCTLRKYMNNEMLNEMFSKEEQKLIMKVINKNSNNPKYGTIGGNDTEDRLFLLSIDEANQFFASDEARCAKPTAYAKSKKAYTDDKTGNAWWWLRSPGGYSNCAAYVNFDGSVLTYGDFVSDDVDVVRPACWVNLENL